MATTSEVKKRVPGVERLTRPYIDGSFVDASTDETFSRVSPVTGEFRRALLPAMRPTST